MKKKIVLLLALLAVFPVSSQVNKIPPDPKVVALVQKFITALTIADEKQRLDAVVPLLHKSLLTKDGKDIVTNEKQFQYKRAGNMVKLYENPIVVTAADKGPPRTIGSGAAAEKGRVDKYFIKKKPDVNGMPAPIQVFLPDQGEPSIFYMGSM